MKIAACFTLAVAGLIGGGCASEPVAPRPETPAHRDPPVLAQHTRPVSATRPAPASAKRRAMGGSIDLGETECRMLIAGPAVVTSVEMWTLAREPGNALLRVDGDTVGKLDGRCEKTITVPAGKQLWVESLVDGDASLTWAGYKPE